MKKRNCSSPATGWEYDLFSIPQTKRSFLFGSEIKTLFEHPDVKPEIDPVSMSQVFTFWSTITPRTIFKGIYELPPGHFMKISQGKQ